MNRENKSLGFGIAACSVAANADGEIQLIPAGKFRGVDGRPLDVPQWVMDADAAKDVIAFCSARKNPFVIDYEHQTLHTSENGQPAPAAGWFSGAALRWEEGKGLFAKPDWTPRAQGYLAADEYKFISPVILYKKVTGRIVGLLSAALTNNACIDGMDDVLSRAAASFMLDESTSKESITMDMTELLEQLRWMLNLPALATPEEITAELQKAVALIKAGNADATAAAGFSITGLIASLGTQVSALKSAAPDPAKYVPLDAVRALQTEVAALRAGQIEREVGEVVGAALASGKLLPAQKDWAVDLGKSNIAALRQYVETAQAVAALTGTQTEGVPPAGQAEGELSEAELTMCNAMGVKPEDFKRTKAENAIAV